jgi:hypothetical protein
LKSSRMHLFRSGVRLIGTYKFEDLLNVQMASRENV